MHLWGDGDVDWEGVNAAAELIGQAMRDAGCESASWKEKYGSVRCYCYITNDSQKRAYHKAYAAAVEKFPYLYREILACADHPELLVGIIDPDECEHYWWVGKFGSEKTIERCSLCGATQEHVEDEE